jgi:hypothetical protein
MCRDVADVDFVALGREVSVLASAIREDVSIDITKAELSQLFGHTVVGRRE